MSVTRSASDPILLIVSVDVEEDAWTATPPHFRVQNLRELHLLMALLERLAVRPTLFTSYQVATHAWACELLREYAVDGRAEIGALLHTWNTPPPHVEAHETPPSPLLRDYSATAQAAKIAELRRSIEAGVGIAPTAFRTASLTPESVTALLQYGFRSDSSVTPHSPPPYRSVIPIDGRVSPIEIHRLDVANARSEDRRQLVEVPVSTGFTNLTPHDWGRVAELLKGGRTDRLMGLATRWLQGSAVTLNPEYHSVPQMMALSRRLLASGVRHLHLSVRSSALQPGLRAATRSRRHVTRLYERIEDFVSALRQMAPVRDVTVSEAAHPFQREASPPAHRVTPVGGNSLTRPHRTPARNRHPRLLIVTYHYPPDGSVGGLRWAGLSKYLARSGWEVHILTANPAAPAAPVEGVQIHVVRRGRILNDVYVAAANRLRGGPRPTAAPEAPAEGAAPPSPRFGLLRAIRREIAAFTSYPDESRGWIGRAAEEARTLIRRYEPDVLVSSGPPHGAHLVAWLATLDAPVPRVMDLRDPWVGQSRMWENHPVYGTPLARWVSGRLERLCNRAARATICNTPELTERWRVKYPRQQIWWVPNGVDLERLPRRPANRYPGLAIVHAGTLYGGRDLEPIIDGFAQFLRRHPEAGSQGSRLRVAGAIEGPHMERLRRSIEKHKVQSFVEILGMLDAKSALDTLGRSGVGIVLAQDQEVQVPAKLYETMGMGLPTLVITEPGSATAREAERIGAIVRRSTDTAGIAEEFARIWTAGAMDSPPPPVISYEHLARSMGELVDQTGPVPIPLARTRLKSEPRGNWMWFLEPERSQSLLDVVHGESIMGVAMQPRFPELTILQLSDIDPARDQILPYPDGSFDCVTLHGVLPALMKRVGERRSRAIFGECYRVLRDGGCLYVAGDNHLDYRLLLSGRPEHGLMGPVVPLLSRLGFSRVQRFYATPSHDDPKTIIPANQIAAGAYERFGEIPSWRTSLRRLINQTGLFRMLYQSLVVVAYK